MPNVDEDTTQEPLRVSILRHGGHLVASIHTALDDGQLVHFRRLLLEQIGRYRARGVIIDVAAGKARTARRSVAGPAVTWSGGPGRRPSGRR
jgi:hypothetical protein